MSQRSAGTSPTQSTPAARFSQNSSTLRDFGNAPDIPITAIASPATSRAAPPTGPPVAARAASEIDATSKTGATSEADATSKTGSTSEAGAVSKVGAGSEAGAAGTGRAG